MAETNDMPTLGHGPRLHRRHVLGLGAAVAFAPFIPKMASAAVFGDPRLIVVVLRGGLDGLAMLPPIGDPDYAAARRVYLDKRTGTPPLPLDGLFALDSNMKTLADLYRRGEALFVDAVAIPYRTRSHFDGQDVLESGMRGPGHTQSGWLARATTALRRAEVSRPRRGLAVGALEPLIMRGAEGTLSWAPSTLPELAPQSTAAIAEAFRDADPEIAAALLSAIETDRLAGRERLRLPKRIGEAPSFLDVVGGSARLMAAPDGPRIAAISSGGWDTHANGLHVHDLLSTLDAAIAQIRDELTSHWRETAVLVVTEFGRTVAVNGTAGTDHGTATVATLVGGAVKGGRVIADWPGLAPKALYEGRDLMPTRSLWSVVKGVLSDFLAIDTATIEGHILPESSDIRPLTGLFG